MVRAWPGGFGYAKVGANYGPSLVAQAEAREQGFDQVLWLLGSQCKVTEAGASNFFVIWRTTDGKHQLVTAPLEDKVILDGVTRRSLLDLSKEMFSKTYCGLKPLEIVERTYTMGEIDAALEEGRLVEAFAAGTALRMMNRTHSYNLDFVLMQTAVFYRSRRYGSLSGQEPGIPALGRCYRKICTLPQNAAGEHYVWTRET